MEFDSGFDLDFSGCDAEDFGLAKSFSTAPLGLGAPGINHLNYETCEPENDSLPSQIGADSFNFKMFNTADQAGF